MVKKIYDKYRNIEITIESWLYYVDDPSVKIQSTTNKFPYEEYSPFTTTRKEWQIDIINITIARLTQLMIDEFGNRGIDKQAGDTQGSPSINWAYKIIDAKVHYKIDKEKVEEEMRKYEEQRQKQKEKDEQKKQKDEQKRKAKLEKLQKKAEQKPKPEPIVVPVIIDEEPTTLTFKKELSTLNIVQISKLNKSIAKLEKEKQEKQSFVDMYNERLKSERIDLALSSTKQRDEWKDMLDVINIKIERQKEAIEKIKIGG